MEAAAAVHIAAAAEMTENQRDIMAMLLQLVVDILHAEEDDANHIARAVVIARIPPARLTPMPQRSRYLLPIRDQHQFCIILWIPQDVVATAINIITAQWASKAL